MPVWGTSEKMYFYFDEDQLIIYPAEKGGFDKVFARIHISNYHSRAGDVRINYKLTRNLGHMLLY